jgi:tRNA(fMet)-specific endonuclease VapC
MLDTNILIYLIKNKPESVIQRVNALGDDDELYMSFVTYAELLRAPKATRARRMCCGASRA